MPTTRNRVPRHTAEDINSRIQRDLAFSVQYYTDHKDEIARRLRELDAEWDIERAIEANAAALGFIAPPSASCAAASGWCCRSP
jgi:predicted GNAT superfamily acetyltransferase